MNRSSTSRPIGRALLLALLFSHSSKADEQPPLSIQEAVSIAVERNPRVAKAAFAVDAARGRAVQSTLQPNPVVSITGDELGDRTGSGGIWTAPRIEQEIVSKSKRRLNLAAADRDIAKAQRLVAAERLQLKAEVETRYIESVVAVKRIEFLNRAVAAAEATVELVKRREAAKEAARLEVLLVETKLDEYRSDLQTAKIDAANSVVRLALLLGSSSLEGRGLQFDLDAPLPSWELEPLLQMVERDHPAVQAASIELQRSQTLVERAKAEPYPNLTLTTGYTRQNQNRSHDWLFGVSAPIPAWNRNQGNVQAARAAVGEAAQELSATQIALRDKAAAAHRDLTAAAKRSEYYRQTVLPKAEEAFRLSSKAFDAGAIDFERLFLAQRSVYDAHLEQLRSTSQAWTAAAALSSLLDEPLTR